MTKVETPRPNVVKIEFKNLEVNRMFWKNVGARAIMLPLPNFTATMFYGSNHLLGK
jgi:hypothetical protein